MNNNNQQQIESQDECLNVHRNLDWEDFFQKFQQNSEQQIKKIRKQEVFPESENPHPTVANKYCYVLYDVISEEESQFFQDQCEQLGFKDLEGYTRSYRTNSRVIVEHKKVADEILHRIRSFIPAEMDSIYDSPVDKGSRWRLKELNDNFRFCKYVPGQFFKAHHDGCFQRSLTEKSFLTFMIYLNGGFTGGETTFLNEDLDPDQSRALKRLNPERGMTLIFQHNMLHEGEPLTSKSKYLMRSDILYERLENLDLADPKVKARELVQLAEFYEVQSNHQKAVEMYKKALALDPSCLNN